MPHTGFSVFSPVCPRCHAALPATLACPNGHGPFWVEDDIGRFLLPERAEALAQFIQEYETVRRAEGRGSDEATYYHSLPFTDTTGKHTGAWKIRAAGYQALVKQVITPQYRCKGLPLEILDLGAGNGWLSYQLAQQGHQVAAVDLQTNAFDGLGAHVHYDAGFDCVQAEFQHLPFADGQFDVVIFNAAIHYATSYEAVLTETLRVLRRRGRLVILDSPVYRDRSSGQQMVAEREAYFQKNHGFPSNALPSQHYLTHEKLGALGETLNLTWRLIRPRHGLKWQLRPVLAQLLRRREPAQFYVIEGQRTLDWPEALQQTLGPTAPAWQVQVLNRLYRLRYHLIQKRQLNRTAHERVAGLTLDIPPGVFNPVPFRTADLMAEVVPEHVHAGQRVLDMGSGSGLGALLAAQQGCTVDAVDLNSVAVQATRKNAETSKLADHIQVFQGDLFTPLQGRTFDVILFNPPFFAGPPESIADAALRSVDVIERFADALPHHLTPDGRALVLFSTKGCMERFLDTFLSRNFYIRIVSQIDRTNEVLYAFMIEPARAS